MSDACLRLHQILDVFLRHNGKIKGQIGQVGDVDGGDGVRFFADSADDFRYDTYTRKSKTPESISLKRADVEAFDRILKKALKLTP